ncbi:glycoside hydrolase family 3 C-terminal domain-containing protein [Acidothermaceae bacterium B102]|nr:glycoside hydrolase family 3 C-terminal domain-containing protein [Acidothermaceae bacterium B102]
MKTTTRGATTVTLLSAATLVATAFGSAAPVAAAPHLAPTVAQPWMNTHLTAAKRASLVLAQMTLDEKIAEVHGAGYPTPFNGAGFAGVVPANTRLGIPALYLADSPVGVGNGSTGVTQWADTTALAASWDTSLAKAYGTAYGAEQAGKGHNIALAPTVNILRLPLWGRAPETFSEDPYLTAQSAAAEIEGIQSQHVIATVKHFVANNQEVFRSSINVNVSQRALEEIYQPAFQTAVETAKVGAVMCSYNRINGTYGCENGEELKDTLRDAWSFDGLVMSDWAALHTTVRAARNGLDLEMPGAADDAHLTPVDQIFGSYFNSKLKNAVLAGTVKLSQLNAMVTHILTAMFRIGLFDHPLASPDAVKAANVSTPGHLALSTKIADSGAVLLKNSHGLLPLKDTGSIAVIGDASSEHPQTAAGGSAVVQPSSPVVTALAGITTRAGSAATVTHAQGTLGVAALPAVPAASFPAGLTATYYATADLSGTPVSTATVPDLAISGTPAAVATLATWSASYAGTLTAPAAGDYRFTLSAGGDATLFVDGTKVAGYAPMHEPFGEGIITLTAGAHTVRVEETPFPGTLVGVDAFAVTPGLHVGWQPQENLLIEQAAAAAAAANIAVVVVSDPTSEGMDRSTLALPGDQDKLIAAVAAANPRTVVVLNTASAVLMPWLSSVAAVIEGWYPGQTGGTALAKLLFGDVNPSGKLPVTFPASDAQGPARASVEYPGDGTDVYYSEGLQVGYRWYDAQHQKPLFPFGYGLSYTSFAFSHVAVKATGSTYVVTATVKNTGKRAGAEVAQLYLGFPSSAHEVPRSLKAYAKVSLKAGQSKRVTLTLTKQAFATWDSLAAAWVVHTGAYQLWVGDSSRHLPLKATVTLG